MALSSSSNPTISFLVLALAIFLIAAPAGATALTCNDVMKYMKPCIEYLKNGMPPPPPNGSGKPPPPPPPPPPCCTGVKNLARAATTKADKQTACGCLKNATKNIHVKPQLAKSLPGKCGISLPYEVSPIVDCTKIR